ncbi:MAG: T9SS type A sorting domain-containing protein [Bacteroidia bacterium]
MKRFAFLLILLSVTISNHFAQSWQKMNGASDGFVLGFTTHNSYWFTATYAGVFRSGDNGNTWESVIDAISSKDILIQGNRVWAAGYDGVHYSDDDGNTWTFEPINMAGEVTTMTIFNNELWIGTRFSGIFKRTSANNWQAMNQGFVVSDHLMCQKLITHNGTVYLGGARNLFRRNLATNTWDSLGNATSNLIYSAGFGCLASDGTNLYTYGHGWGFYYSSNNGTTWSQANQGIFDINTSTCGSIVFHNNAVFLAGSVGLFKNTFPFTNAWQTLDNDTDYYYLGKNGNSLVRGAGIDGFGVSNDNGLTWAANGSGLTDYISGITTNGSDIFTSGYGSGIEKLTSNGTWQDINNFNTVSNPGGYAVIWHNNKLFASRASSYQVHVSNNNGTSWTNIGSSFPYAIAPIHFASNGGRLYAAMSDASLYYTDNDGTNWTMTNSPGHYTYDLAFSGNQIWAATDSGVFVSANQGSSWTYKGMGSNNIYSIAITNGRILIGTFDYGVYASDNNGTTWNAVNNGDLGSVSVFDLYANGDFIVAGSIGSGAFYSSDKGNTWTEWNTNLSNYYILCLAAKGNELYAGTVGGGVYKIDITSFVGIENQLDETLVQVYPNPVNDKLYVTFNDQNNEVYKLKLLDINGKLVYQQNNTSVLLETTINVSSFTKGIYFLTISNTKGELTKKIVIE